MFRLQRYLSFTNLSAMVVALTVMTGAHYLLELEDLKASGERENLASSPMFLNSLSALYLPLLANEGGGRPEGEVQRELRSKLSQAVHEHIDQTSIDRITFFDLTGQRVFSTQPSDLTEPQEISNILLRVLEGEVVSRRGSKSAITSEAHPLVLDMLETYIPIRSESDGTILGVLAISRGISPLIQRLKHETGILALIQVLIMMALFACQLFIGRRAEKTIRRQEAENKKYLKALQISKANQEHRIKERTAELAQANTDLLEEVTRREQVEYELRDSEHLFRSITASAHDAILLIDPLGRVTYWNRAAEQLFGYSLEEASGQPLQDFIASRVGHGFTSYEEIKTAALALTQEKPQNLTAATRDGKRIPIEISLSSLKLKGEINTVWLVRDLSLRITAEQKIQADLHTQKVISAIHETALEARDLASKLDRILELVVSISLLNKVMRGAIFLTRGAEKEAYLVAQIGITEAPEELCVSRPYDYDPCQQALLLRQVVLVESSSQPHYLVPILSATGHLHGMLIVYVDKDRVKCSDLEAFLQLVAHTLASLVEFHRADEEVHKLSHAVEQSHTSIWITDRHGVIEYVNPCACALTGYGRDELIGMNPSVVQSGSTPLKVYQQMWHTLLSGQEWRGELQNRKKTGELYWESVSISPIKNAQGEITNFIAVKEDITEAKKSLETLHIRDRAIEASSNAICILDATVAASPTIYYVNPSFCHMTGFEGDEVTGRSFEHLLDNQEELPVGGELPGSSKLEHQHVQVVRSLLRKGGESFWCELDWSPICNQQGVVTHFVLIMEDITDRKKTEEQLIHLATHDSLTKLPNRTLLKDRLERTILQALRHDKIAAVLFIDLDNFKIINDNLGHSIGDQLLTEVSQRLLESVRKTDTVARQGGDEFVIVLTDLPDEIIVHSLILKVFSAFEQPFWVDERELEVTFSMGVSLFPRDGENVETLFQHADIAMYRAKENGRNSYQVYDEQMGRLLLEKTNIQHGLRHAIEAGELLLHYQPKVDIHSGEMVGCEALVRWQHPEWGLVPPGKFIDIAEESGLILPLGEWVLHTATRQVKAWLDAGLCAVPVAVNLSAKQLLQQDIVLVTQQALLASELDPQYLELEITESMMMDNPDKAIKVLNELKAIGIKLAVDDFGTGYSSLAYLKRFPIDRVKIDREFVKNIATDPDDEAIVSATISMSHHLHYKVVAEGVETQEQLKYLRSHGCDEIQGYYFSPPVPPEKFAQLLSSWRRIDTDSLRIEADKKTPRLQAVRLGAVNASEQAEQLYSG